MSGSGKKKKGLASGIKGWEEAGGEFYQECYPGVEVDLEVMKNDPQRISTLLPSKKNRTGTVTLNKKDTKLTTLRYRSCNRSVYQQTTLAASNDIQISFMPDLSENLSNEELLWEEIRKIKAMPVNMAQKKEMKAKLESKDTLRLQGFKQFCWKRKRAVLYFKVRFRELNEKLTIWSNSLKKIEGYHGSGVVSFFLFLKWLIFLNIVISFIICTMIIYPTILYKRTDAININNHNYNDSFVNKNTTDSINRSTNDDNEFFRLFIDKGWLLSKVPLYYQYYENGRLPLPYFGNDYYYDLSLAYISAACLYFLFSFLMVLKNAADGFKRRLLEHEGQFYVYCNTLFSGWDFCVKNRTSADVKRKAIYNEIVGRLNLERYKTERDGRTRKESFKLLFRRIIVNAIILSLLSAAGLTIFLSFEYSNRTIVVVDDILLLPKLLRNLIVEYATAGFIVLFNVVLPIIFRRLSTYEKFANPFSAAQITIFRTILLRYSSLCVLLASFYERAQTSEAESSTIVEDCWTNLIGREFYKLLALNLLANIFATFLIDFPRSFLAARIDNKLCRWLGRQEFHLPTHVLDVVYIQTIVWLGSFYAPLLPTFGIVIYATLFYVKKFACLINCVPTTNRIYYASKSRSLYMFVLLFSLAFSVVPLTISIIEFTSDLQPPHRCGGPFVGKGTAWTVVRETFESLPLPLKDGFRFCLRPIFVVPLFVVLCLTNYYYYSVYKANKQMVNVLKRQLILEGHDKQFLLNRLSAFIKQQQKYYRPIGTEI